MTWCRAQISLWAAQGYRVSRITEIGFTSGDLVRELIHNFKRDRFSSLTSSSASIPPRPLRPPSDTAHPVPSRSGNPER